MEETQREIGDKEDKIQVELFEKYTKNRNNYDKIHIHVNANDTIVSNTSMLLFSTFHIFCLLACFFGPIPCNFSSSMTYTTANKQRTHRNAKIFYEVCRRTMSTKWFRALLFETLLLSLFFQCSYTPTCNANVTLVRMRECSFWCGIIQHLAIQIFT